MGGRVRRASSIGTHTIPHAVARNVVVPVGMQPDELHGRVLRQRALTILPPPALLWRGVPRFTREPAVDKLCQDREPGWIWEQAGITYEEATPKAISVNALYRIRLETNNPIVHKAINRTLTEISNA